MSHDAWREEKTMAGVGQGFIFVLFWSLKGVLFGFAIIVKILKGNYAN
jgi:hypothetical protein